MCDNPFFHPNPRQTRGRVTMEQRVVTRIMPAA
jgi:hypothetical protein